MHIPALPLRILLAFILLDNSPLECTTLAAAEPRAEHIRVEPYMQAQVFSMVTPKDLPAHGNLWMLVSLLSIRLAEQLPC